MVNVLPIALLSVGVTKMHRCAFTGTRGVRNYKFMLEDEREPKSAILLDVWGKSTPGLFYDALCACPLAVFISPIGACCVRV